MDTATDANDHAMVLAHSPDAVAASARFLYTWHLFVAQLCLLALFIGMSLVAVAVSSWLSGDRTQRTSVLVTVLLAGVALTLLAWGGGKRRFARLAVDNRHPVQTELLLVSGDALPVQSVSLLSVAHSRNGTLLASHR